MDSAGAFPVPLQADIIPARELTGDLFSRFIEYIDARPKTVESYRRAVKQFYRWTHDQGIRQPNRADVLQYREHIRAKLKPGTVQAYIIALRQFFKWTAREGLYPNIADNVKGAKLDRGHKKDTLTTAQLQDILKRFRVSTEQGARDYAIIALMVTGCLRDIEVSRANAEDLRPVGDSMALYIQGKGRDEKTEYVKITHQVEKAIRRYLSFRRKGGTDSGPGAPLFASIAKSNKGQRMTPRSISRIVKQGMRAAGYDSERLTAHSLRHTGATVNLLNGGTLEETQQLLRHSSISTTMIYLHHLDRAKNQSENRIADAIFAGRSAERKARGKVS